MKRQEGSTPAFVPQTIETHPHPLISSYLVSPWGKRGSHPIILYLWGLQVSNEAGSLIRPLEAPCFMNSVRAPRVGLIACCTPEGALKRYSNTCCFTQVVRQAVFIVSGAPVRGLLFAGPGSGAYCFRLGLVRMDCVCSVMCWFRLCMFVMGYDDSWLLFMCLVYCSL